MLNKWIDATWPPFVALIMIVAYTVFAKYGWSRGECAAFASIAGFLSLGLLTIVESFIQADSTHDNDLGTAAAASILAGIMSALAAVFATASWPIILSVAMVIVVAVIWFTSAVMNAVHSGYPTIGRDWLQRKSLLPAALVLGLCVTWGLETASTFAYSWWYMYGLVMCGGILLAQLVWTIRRWPSEKS